MKEKGELKLHGFIIIGQPFVMMDGMTMMQLLYVNSWATLEDLQEVVRILVKELDQDAGVVCIGENVKGIVNCMNLSVSKCA